VAAAIMPLERARRSLIVLKIAALVLAAASTSASPPALVSSAPWWEKVTVTVNSDGEPRSCSYQTSLTPTKAKSCAVSGTSAALASDSVGSKDEFTRITFERRFSPTAEPGGGTIHPTETLLGGQVMALAIDSAGTVKGCKIVATSGDMTPDYGCAEAATERFEASGVAKADHSREGFMTILVYGHAEHVA
jgi:hypothetical protein